MISTGDKPLSQISVKRQLRGPSKDIGESWNDINYRWVSSRGAVIESDDNTQRAGACVCAAAVSVGVCLQDRPAPLRDTS